MPDVSPEERVVEVLHGLKEQTPTVNSPLQLTVPRPVLNSSISTKMPYQDLNVYTFLTQEEMCQKCVDISVIKSYEKQCQRGF